MERIQLEQKGNTVVDLDSGTEFTGEELVSMNYWVCKPSIFNAIENDLKTFLENGENLEKGRNLYSICNSGFGSTK